MSGFIKFTLIENKKIITTILDTNIINSFFSDYANLFENDIENIIISKSVNKKHISEEYHNQITTLTPFDYGYILIDRNNKICFFLNNYDSLSSFTNFNFNKYDYLELKKQNFQIEFGDFSSKFSKLIDIRKDFISRDFKEYRKLFTSLPYAKTIHSLDVKIKDISNLESIIDELLDLRLQRNQQKNLIINDLIISEFNEWTLIDNVVEKENLEQLFDYLLKQNLLSDQEITIWNQQINEFEDI